MRRLPVVLATIVMLLAACGGDPPRLTMDESVPNDLEALAGEVWTRFLAAFPNQHDCIGEVTLVAAWELDDRAQLDPESRRISLRVPATAPQLTESIIHELGHALEFSCPDQHTIRDRFREAAGFSAGADWFESGAWEDVPSEHWAETVVQYVVGFRLAHAGRVPVKADALDLVAGWANGA